MEGKSLPKRNSKRKSSNISSNNNNKRVRSLNNQNDDYIGTMISLNNQNNDDINWDEWVAATSTRNYMLDDGILDVIQNKGSTLTRVNPKYQARFVKTIGPKDPKSFVSSIMQQGIKFEQVVYGLIKNKIGHENVINIGGDCNPRSKQKYLDTIGAMKEGYTIIYQGVLRNYKNNTYGIPDLLVRSDRLDLLIDNAPKNMLKNKNKSAPNLTKKCEYHYIVIDIKFKTLHLKTDGIHLRNDGPMKAYKSQLCIYNEALGIMQGYKPSAAFILGWKWKYVSKNIEYRGDNCFDRLGRIDYKYSDKEYVEKTQNAVDWVLKVRNEASEWDLSKVPLPCEELYPNMCNRYDFPHHKLKKKFAEDIEEISLIWKCGPKQRKIAHENGIYSWKDPRCTPETVSYTHLTLPTILLV